MTARRLPAPRPPVPSAPTWTPLPGGEPWETRWQGAAEAIPRGIPRYAGDVVWRRRRNDQLRKQYGTEQMS